MKTLHEGNKTKQKPWVGMVLECPHCGWRGELEEGDDKLPSIHISAVGVMVQCETCGEGLAQSRI